MKPIFVLLSDIAVDDLDDHLKKFRDNRASLNEILNLIFNYTKQFKNKTLFKEIIEWIDLSKLMVAIYSESIKKDCPPNKG